MSKLTFLFAGVLVVLLTGCGSNSQFTLPDSAQGVLGSACGSGHTEPEILCRVRQKITPLATKAELESRTTLALTRNDIDSAEAYVSLADTLYISLEPRLRETYLSRLKEGGQTISMSGSAKELFDSTKSLISGNGINMVDFGLSIMGFAAGAGEYVLPQKFAEPTKVGVAVLKQAIRNREVSGNFYGLLTQVFSQGINVAGIKTAWQSSAWTDKVTSPYQTLLAQNVNLTSFAELFLPIYRMQQNSSLGRSVLMLKYVNDINEFKQVEQLASVFKKSTPAVLEFLGKSAYGLI